MRLEYKTLEEAQKSFRLEERWEVFDRGKDHLNIGYECIDRHPKEKTALRIKFDDGHSEIYTFGQLSSLTSKFANMLQRIGVDAGDRLLLILYPSLEFYVGLFGSFKRGAVAVSCLPLLSPDAIEYRVTNSNAKAIIVSREKASSLSGIKIPHLIIAEDLIESIQKEDDHFETNTSADTLAMIQFSSGTTGKSTPVPYRHAAAALTAVNVKLCIGMQSDDRYFCPISPAWGFGIWYGSVGPLTFGTAIGASSGRFDAENILQALEEFQITNLSAAPMMYRLIMDSGKLENYSLNLRRLTFSGGHLEMDVIQYFQEKLGIFPQSFYGSTEVGVAVLDYAFDDYKAKPGSMGKPMLGVKVGLLDEKGEELPTEQVGQFAIWRRGEWVKVGDAAMRDEDGYFWHKGRLDDVIKSSGYTIGSVEVEDVLMKHPAVRMAAVVGSPDKQRGEIVKAFIVTDQAQTKELKQEIQEFVKGHLSLYAYPREVEFVSELPRTPDGKLRRVELRELERKRKLSTPT